MKEEWNKRYEQAGYFYGTEPNQWLVEVLKQMQPGKVLFPAEGEGRNAVYAATQGWQVWAFDQSEMGKKKAEELAQAKGVSIHYALADARQVDYPDAFFDALVFIYAHFTQPGRKEIMQHLMKSLKPGGLIVFEGFSKQQIQYQETFNSGGPRNAEMLYSVAEVRESFGDILFNYLQEELIYLSEGIHHSGQAAVVRFAGRKI